MHIIRLLKYLRDLSKIVVSKPEIFAMISAQTVIGITVYWFFQPGEINPMEFTLAMTAILGALVIFLKG